MTTEFELNKTMNRANKNCQIPTEKLRNKKINLGNQQHQQITTYT